VLPAAEPASDRQMRAWEKELTGMYHGDHPLVARLGEIQGVITAYSNDLDESWHERSATLAGTIASLRPHTTAKGKPMAFAKLEDLGGAVELLIFPGTWAKVQSWLSLEQLVLVSGKVSYEGGAAKLLVDRIDRELKLVVATDAGPGDEMAADEFFSSEAAPADMPVDEPFAGAPAWDEPGPSSVAEAMPVASREGALDTELLPIRKEQPLAAARHRITVTLRPGKDLKNYKQRVNRAHNLLTSFPGPDQFVIVVFEEERCFELEFGGQTTGHCAELLQQLAAVVQSPEDVDVQPLLL
jgi:DNA polymerase-3 subunit alpha